MSLSIISPNRHLMASRNLSSIPPVASHFQRDLALSGVCYIKVNALQEILTNSDIGLQVLLKTFSPNALGVQRGHLGYRQGEVQVERERKDRESGVFQ